MNEEYVVLFNKVVAGAVTTLAVSALTMGAAVGVSYADPGHGKGPKAAPAVATTAPAAESVSDTATATIAVKSNNAVVTAVTFVSDTATATITVKDRKGGAPVTWDVPPTVQVSGFYKKVSDVQPGFTVHLSGTRTGTAAPVADRLVLPGRNKKVLVQNVTVLSVSGATGSMTVRDNKGQTFRWGVRGAKVVGKASRLSALSAGDVVSLRGDVVEGAAAGQATVVRIEKDAKPAAKKAAKKPVKKPAKPVKKKR